MRSKWMTALLVLILLAGFGMLAYPWVSNQVHATSQTYAVEEYRAAVNKMDEAEIEQAKAEAVAYDRKEVESFGQMQSASVQSMFEEDGNDEADDPTQSASYASMLAVGDIIGYLEIPKIQIELPIYAGTSELAMQKGAGHMEGTSMPIGGDGTHCVLASHSGMTGVKLFSDLDQMEVGDQFYLYVLDETHVYQVDAVNVVLPDDTSGLQVEQGKDYVTLLTCTPTGTNTHRLLVRGIRVPGDEISDEDKNGDGKSEDAENHLSLNQEKWKTVLAGGVFIIAFIFIALGIVKFVRKILAAKRSG